MSDIIERAITPFNPASSVIHNRDKYNLFAPMAGTNKIGMAGFNPRDFSVNEQIVSLNENKVALFLPRVDVKNLSDGVEYSRNGFKTPNIWYYDDDGAILVTAAGNVQSEFDITNNRFRELTVVDGVVTIVGEWRDIFDELGNIVDDLSSIFVTLDTKVDKILGMGLSENDYTTPEKNKLVGIEAGAQVNIIEKIAIKGVEQDIASNVVTIAPSDINVSDLTDDTTEHPIDKSDFATEAEKDADGNTISSTYVKKEQIVDNVASSDTDKPLSANQGKELDGKITSETNRATEAEVVLSQRLDAQEGLGGMLSAHDFGTDTPYEAENGVVLIDLITPYALGQIPSIDNDETKIWNGTKVSNLFDGRTWQLTNTQNTTPVIFQWVNIGATFMAKATNNTLGVGKGSDTVKVNAGGEFYTSTDLIGAATDEQVEALDTKTTQASEAAQDAAEFMMYALGTTPIWDAEGEYILADAEDENTLADTYINAAAINGREFYVMTKAAHNALVQAGTYIPDALYLTF